MDISEPKILDASEPLSKALDEILSSGTAVFVVKDKSLFGLIDDRNMRLGLSDASKTKCDSVCVRCPSIAPNAGVQGRMDAFLSGHFKALPVVDAKGRITGATSRADLLRDLVEQKLVPKAQVYQHMGRPAYTIEYSKSVADAKTLMKKTGAHHLVVTRGGNITGTISTFDFTGFLMKPKERQSFQLISDAKGFDGKRIEEILRPGFSSIPETATLEEAAQKMAFEGISNLVVVAEKKPVGVITATDIFKLVRSLFVEEKDVLVSGLDSDSLAYYGRIKGDILAITSKFDQALKIEGLSVHIKKGKSVYEAHLSFDLNNRHTSFKTEAYSLGETISAISKELKIMLEKSKSEKMERKKPPKSEPEE